VAGNHKLFISLLMNSANHKRYCNRTSDFHFWKSLATKWKLVNHEESGVGTFEGTFPKAKKNMQKPMSNFRLVEIDGKLLYWLGNLSGIFEFSGEYAKIDLLILEPAAKKLKFSCEGWCRLTVFGIRDARKYLNRSHSPTANSENQIARTFANSKGTFFHFNWTQKLLSLPKMIQ